MRVRRRDEASGKADGSVGAELTHVAQDFLLVGEELLPFEEVLDPGRLVLCVRIDLCLDAALHLLTCLEIYPL